MNDTVLQVQGLRKKYPAFTLSEVSFSLEAGRIMGFIGRNGAGKTTTIKSCCGILQFEEGEIYVDGVSIREDPIGCKRKIAYLPDNPDLYEFLSGVQYLNFIADVYGVPKEEREQRIKEYADLFGLTEDLAQPISAYSHGMKQKVAIISALVHEPKLLVLDEPFVGLDPKAALDLKNIMKELCRQGSAIFFSTHVLEVAQKLCNKIAIIKDGKLVTSGNMEEVVKNQSLEDLFMEVTTDDK